MKPENILKDVKNVFSVLKVSSDVCQLTGGGGSVLFFQPGGDTSPLSGGHDGVHHLDDPVQCRVSSDGHVGATEIVVDGADHADDVELRVTAGCLLADQT